MQSMEDGRRREAQKRAAGSWWCGESRDTADAWRPACTLSHTTPGQQKKKREKTRAAQMLTGDAEASRGARSDEWEVGWWRRPLVLLKGASEWLGRVKMARLEVG